MRGEILPETSQRYQIEAQAVEQVLGIDRSILSDNHEQQFDSMVGIVGQFSRTNPQTGAYETISPSRIAAIPAITARHMELVAPARGELDLWDVERIWHENMPTNQGDRHPDLLFDIAQFNFGTDAPLGAIEREVMASELRRRELMERYRSAIRFTFNQYKNQRHIDDDTPEEVLEDYVDSLTRG